MGIFTLKNDLKQIEFQDSLCIFRGYFSYGSCAIINYSFLLQSIYRYVRVVYPTRLFYQSRQIQLLFIVITWIIGFVLPIPVILTGEIVYNVNNQICLIPLGLSFFPIYAANFVYIIPVLMIMLIYFKLIVYVREMNKRVTPINTLLRVKRELKMVRRTVILIMILLTLGFPYALFIFMSFFTIPPKYHFRIALIFIDVSLVLVLIALFQFTDPLKTSIMKLIKMRPNVVVATVAQINE